jgi:hypothetical protein
MKYLLIIFMSLITVLANGQTVRIGDSLVRVIEYNPSDTFSVLMLCSDTAKFEESDPRAHSILAVKSYNYTSYWRKGFSVGRYYTKEYLDKYRRPLSKGTVVWMSVRESTPNAK